jgi:hypothetical protein
MMAFVAAARGPQLSQTRNNLAGKISRLRIFRGADCIDMNARSPS